MFKDGIHGDISPAKYHAWQFDIQEGPISCSLLKRYAADGPAKFRLGREFKATSAMAWGSLVDCMLFTPGELGREFDLHENNPHLSADGAVRSKDAKTWRDAVLTLGKTIVKQHEVELATSAVESLHKTPASGRLIEGGRFQLALFHTPDTSKIPLKALLDCVPANDSDSLVDLKTTSMNIYSDDELARAVGKYKYHAQAAFYLHLWEALTGEVRNQFKIIWQSSQPPFEVRVTTLDNLWLDAGREFVRYHCARLVRDMQTQFWKSPFSESESTLALHTGTVWDEEGTMELLNDVSK